MHPFIARVRNSDNSPQPLSEHLLAVAEMSEKAASKVNLPSLGRLVGLLHDLGKYSDSFQSYIRDVTGLNGVEAQKRANSQQGKVDHATAGAQKIWNELRVKDTEFGLIAAQILAICVAGHHGGLLDFVGPHGKSEFLKRMKKSPDNTFINEVEEKCESEIKEALYQILSSKLIFDELKPRLLQICQNEKIKRLRAFHLGLLTRFIFSGLIDGDRSNSADFEKPFRAELRNNGDAVDWSFYAATLESHLATLKPRNQVDELRNSISQECFDAASRPQGMFTLAVPTGGGKTLASLRFALNHAKHHSAMGNKAGFERIIYVIPYTTIIDQNAKVLSDILGAESVLEHHSNLIMEDDENRIRILTENWDAPIVLTTSVQFLNALFSASTTDVRRMHAMANAVIIFDEIQSLPIKTIHLFNNAVNFLVQTCGSSIVFCTAT